MKKELFNILIEIFYCMIFVDILPCNSDCYDGFMEESLSGCYA